MKDYILAILLTLFAVTVGVASNWSIDPRGIWIMIGTTTGSVGTVLFHWVISHP